MGCRIYAVGRLCKEEETTHSARAGACHTGGSASQSSFREQRRVLRVSTLLQSKRAHKDTFRRICSHSLGSKAIEEDMKQKQPPMWIWQHMEATKACAPACRADASIIRNFAATLEPRQSLKSLGTTFFGHAV